MNIRKTLGPVALSLVLINSSWAWAFLKCDHERDSFSDQGKLQAPSSEPLSEADAPELECSHPDYQIGPVAAGSFSAGISKQADAFRLNVSAVAPVAQALYISRISHFLQRFALFDKLSVQFFLSILRI